MIKLIFSPHWFYNTDIIFEVFFTIVTLAIGFYSYKFYKFSKNYKYKYFALSFFAFAAAFTAKILTNFVLYYQKTVKTTFNEVIVKYNLLPMSKFFFFLGYDFYRLFYLLALIGIYWLISKSKDYEHQWLFFYLAIIISIFSYNAYFIFHLTSAFLLFFIVKHYHEISYKKKNKRTYINFLAFLFLFVGEITFIFIWLDKVFYVIAETLLLISFVMLLSNYLRLVLRKNG